MEIHNGIFDPEAYTQLKFNYSATASFTHRNAFIGFDDCYCHFTWISSGEATWISCSSHFESSLRSIRRDADTEYIKSMEQRQRANRQVQCECNWNSIPPRSRLWFPWNLPQLNDSTSHTHFVPHCKHLMFWNINDKKHGQICGKISYFMVIMMMIIMQSKKKKQNTWLSCVTVWCSSLSSNDKSQVWFTVVAAIYLW